MIVQQVQHDCFSVCIIASRVSDKSETFAGVNKFESAQNNDDDDGGIPSCFSKSSTRARSFLFSFINSVIFCNLGSRAMRTLFLICLALELLQ